MKVAVGCDHAGFPLKGTVLDALDKLGLKYEDFGCFSEESVDYPDIGAAVARAVASGEYDRGVLVCGSGIGMSMVANKVKGIRAANCENAKSAGLSRLHNDANVLTLGARVVAAELAVEIVKEWFQTEFDGGRHGRRVNKITEIEREESCQGG
jgi:ribose 5-phosphate isomerase B